MRNENSLATVLLVSRMHATDVRPLSAPQYWNLRKACSRPEGLLGRTEQELKDKFGLPGELSGRIAALMDRARAMAFELEQLDHAGIWTVTPFDDCYPRRLIDRLGSNAPALLHGAGLFDLLDRPGLGAVGSRDISPEGAQVARDIAVRAVELGLTVVSGGARGADQLAMNAAFQAGGEVVGVPADALIRRLRSSDLRRAIHDERAVFFTPFHPKAPYRVWNAMGRNKMIYALSEITVAVASESGKGGTWSGATEAHKREFGRVGVWRGPGEGPGNKLLEELGAEPIRSIEDLEGVMDSGRRKVGGLSKDKHSPSSQGSLFEKTA